MKFTILFIITALYGLMMYYFGEKYALGHIFMEVHHP